MTDKKLDDAIGVLVSAAEARLQQWQGVGEGKSPDDLVDELWESLSTGCIEAIDMAEIIEDAIRTVQASRRLKIQRIECEGVGDNNGFFEVSVE